MQDGLQNETRTLNRKIKLSLQKIRKNPNIILIFSWFLKKYSKRENKLYDIFNSKKTRKFQIFCRILLEINKYKTKQDLTRW